ncbi:MAG: asparagine synthase (glutamine-hydrolyzing) [Proteobacteria bacterium]|nr:asparagine synthase (glutamine-hydrolyzing) [Pseudomonadota bacterium]
MCGIAAIFKYNDNRSPVESEELIRIRETMTSRGPDGAGIWTSDDGRVGLAHRRLSIIDLSDRGSQPMMSADGIFRIVFNGEIYNYQPLRAELEKKGYRFRSNSDTEVLLHLYAEKGRLMVHDLRGMYAFVIWDKRKKDLFLARDPFGIKPLYYADDGHSLRVASQVKALIKGGHINTDPEPAGHVGFLLWGYVPEPYTLYQGIRLLPAGSTLWIDKNGRKELNSFYRLADELARGCEINQKMGVEEAKHSLRTALVDSVRHHLIADVPVGLFLSSGLDSAVLTALASEIVPYNLHTITLGFNEYKKTEHDETSLAKIVAQHYGTKHQTKWISRDDFQSDLDNLLAAMDQPSVDGVNTYFVSKVAAEAGMKVALSGLGGDELFAGYPGFRQIPQMVNALSPFRFSPSFGKGFCWVSAPIMKHFTSPKYAGLLEYGNCYAGAYLLRRGLFMPWELPGIIDGEMVREGLQELKPLLRLEQTIDGIKTDRLKVSALEITWYMRNQLLRDADWAGMAHSLEIRVPFVDVDLLRNLMPLLTLGKPPSKRDMAKVLTNPLPDELLNRPKTGFSVPVREWLMLDGGSMTTERGLRGWALKLYNYVCNKGLIY